jgi:hypothetical protein
MKLTIISTLAIVLNSLLGFSQITLDDTDFPNANESFAVSTAGISQVDFASTGPNHVWDFSNLSSNGQLPRDFNSLSGVSFMINFAYGPTAITAYRASYRAPYTDLPINQLGTFLPIELSDVFQYTKKNAQRLNLLGYSVSISGQSLPVKSDTIETKYYFPLDYGDEYTSKGYTKMDLSVVINAQWIQSRKRHSVVDGWGTITTPYGTFDVLRMQHRIEEIDTIVYEGMAFGTPLPVMYEYEWLAADEKIPVLKITTSEVGGNETIVSVEYKDNPILGVENKEVSNVLKLYPNPVNESLSIAFKAGKNNVSIYSVEGALVDSFTFENAVHTFNASHLKSGMYLISIASDGEVTNSTFVKN